MSELRPTPRALISKAVASARTRGPREVVTTAVERVRQAISSEDSLLFLSRTAGGAPPERQGLQLRRATPEDAGLYARDIGTDSATTFERRLTDSTMCFLVVAENRLAHASWVTTSAAWTREIRRYVRPPRGSAYVYESFTRADVRGRGVYPFALQGIVVDLAGDGIDEVWVAVEADNAPSLRAITKAGFEVGFQLAYRRRFGRLTIDPPTGPRAKDVAGFFSRSPE